MTNPKVAVKHRGLEDALSYWGQGTCLGTTDGRTEDDRGHVIAVWQYESFGGQGQQYKVTRHFKVGAEGSERWETSVDLDDATAVQVICYLLN